METVITISGPAKHGKSTTAEILKRNLEQDNIRVMILNFGDYLKLMANKFFDYKGDDYKADPIQRGILQKVGTEIGRKYNENFWVDVVKSTIVAFQDEFDVCIIPDARFPNECNIFKTPSAITNILENSIEVINLKVLRRNFDNQLSDEAKRHASENSLTLYDFNYSIDSESLIELEEKIKIFIEKFLKKSRTVKTDKEAETATTSKTKKYGR